MSAPYSAACAHCFHPGRDAANTNALPSSSYAKKRSPNVAAKILRSTAKFRPGT